MSSVSTSTSLIAQWILCCRHW